MQELFIKQSHQKYINLYPSYNNIESDLIRLCKMALDNEVGVVSVSDDYLEKAWTWLNLSDVKLNSVVNNFNGFLSLDNVYNKVKNSVNSGADIIEVILPPLFFNKDFETDKAFFDDYFLSLVEAKGIKKLKITIESGVLKSVSNIKKVIDLILLYDIDFVKTSSGFYTNQTNINQLNFILEEVKDKNIGVDFLFSNSCDKYVIDDAIRLSKSIIGDNFLNNKMFNISCFLSDFSRFVGKSTC